MGIHGAEQGLDRRARNRESTHRRRTPDAEPEVAVPEADLGQDQCEAEGDTTPTHRAGQHHSVPCPEQREVGYAPSGFEPLAEQSLDVLQAHDEVKAVPAHQLLPATVSHRRSIRVVMNLPAPLVSGRLVRRYQRFLVDVRLDDGTLVTAHCPNSGRLTTCLGEGWPVRLSRSSNPRRRLPYTWELIHNGRCWISVNTIRTNAVAAEGITRGTVPELGGYDVLRREVRVGASRLDLLLEGAPGRCFVEVKSVTLVDGEGRYAFPDAVTARGLKHLHELTAIVRGGTRAAMLFVIQRSDGTCFGSAAAIDPAYAAGLLGAAAAGVEVLAYRAEVDPRRIELAAPVPLCPELVAAARPPGDDVTK